MPDNYVKYVISGLLEKMAHMSLLVCVKGFCESCHFDESIASNTIDKELFAGHATFCDWLLW